MSAARNLLEQLEEAASFPLCDSGGHPDECAHRDAAFKFAHLWGEALGRIKQLEFTCERWKEVAQESKKIIDMRDEEIEKAMQLRIEFGDIIARHVMAMRAAVVAGELESPQAGLQWIKNTLFGPGHYPDIDAAEKMGGAQAMFDKEIADHEQFRLENTGP